MNYEKLFTNSEKLPNGFSKSEIYDLFRKYKNGDLLARDSIISHNIKLVIFLVNKNFSNSSFEKEELVSVGCIGLIKAADSFDISKNVEFATYASHCIQNEILMFIRKNKYNYLNDSFDKVLIVDKDNISLKLEEILISDFNIYDIIEKLEIRKYVRSLILKLNNDEISLLDMYYGIFSNKAHTQKEISKYLNMNQATISKKISACLRHLKEIIINENIKNVHFEKQI